MIPEHYSRDIALRCQSLIRELRPVVKGGLADDRRFGGPLETTFLLALATPMIVLPIERIFKPAEPGAAPAGDDRKLDPALAEEMADVLGPMQKFGAAPFTGRDHWSYVPGYQPFNIADAWPRDLLCDLNATEAFACASDTPAARILRDLRNALAHGGIAYLDADGRQTDRVSAMLAFAGTKTDRNRRLIGLNILRIGEEEFSTFLMAWADWLARPRVRTVLNRLNPLAG
ncbi:MAG TPA: hypothetical protein VKZ79_18255 [Alphaproteobacteria bacterium]|nr:hypothetical protein [Alphaproteobacteria bacterium]